MWTILLVYKTTETAQMQNYKTSSTIISNQSTKETRMDLQGTLGTSSPPPLPSVRIHGEIEKSASKLRKFYGGSGDKLHLGGFKDYDRMGASNNTWNYMMGPLGVKSLLDVGCGRGISTSYFLEKGAKVLCVEGFKTLVLRNNL